MEELKKSKAARVFHYFQEICRIPHGSGNVEQISDYLKAFAEKRQLECIQDETRNIIIIKPASAGYEKEEPIILQGHMDMVAVKKPGYDIDMTKDPLRLMRDGDYLYAEGTSLGGDDGAAVALCLALLEDENVAHPRLEVVLTVDEETGMEGAQSIDLSSLKAKRMINLDSEEEGIFLTSCAGGARVDVHLPVRFVDLPAGKTEEYRMVVEGLQGGHSGTEIIKEGGNANCIMGRILYEMTVQEKLEVSIEKLAGGNADNAIPRQAEAVLWLAPENVEAVKACVGKLEAEIRTELAVKDPGVCIRMEKIGAGAADPVSVLDTESVVQAARLMMVLPNGVQSMSSDVKDLVETSLNLGILDLRKEELLLGYAVRSSLESAKEHLCQRLQAAAALAGADTTIHGAYPGWAYRQDSPLREKMCRVYREMYGKDPEIQALHAGVECGLLMAKIPDLDCVSIGPDMADVHTTEERLSISSTERTWEFLLALLADS